MSCSQTDLTATTITNAPTPTSISGASRSGTSRRLFVSDNPEELKDSRIFTNNMATLWHDTAWGLTRVSYGVYIWHYNNLGTKARIAVTVGNASTTSKLKIENVRWQLSSEIPNNRDFLTGSGLCLAKAQLGGTLDSTTPVDSVVESNRLGIVKEFEISNGYVRGAVLEFDIASSDNSEMLYKVRTVAANSSTANFRNHQGAPVTSDGTHPRGSWSFSDLVGNKITFNLGSGRQSVNISNGSTDNLFTAGSSYDSANALDNKGHYGANYTVNVDLNNNTDSDKTAILYLNARGGTYIGAVRVNNGTTYGVPKISQFTGAVKIHQVLVPKRSTVPVKVELAHGGGGAMPVALLCEVV